MIDLNTATLADLEAAYVALEDLLAELAQERDEDAALTDPRVNVTADYEIAKVEDEMNAILEAMKHVKKETKESQMTLNEEIQKGTQHTFAMVPGGDAKAKDRLTEDGFDAKMDPDGEIFNKLVRLEEAIVDMEAERSAMLRMGDGDKTWTLDRDIGRAKADMLALAAGTAYVVDSEYRIKEIASDEEASGSKESKVVEALASVAQKGAWYGYASVEEAVETLTQMLQAEQEVLSVLRESGLKGVYFDNAVSNMERALESTAESLAEAKADLRNGYKESKVTEELAGVAQKAFDPAALTLEELEREIETTELVLEGLEAEEQRGPLTSALHERILEERAEQRAYLIRLTALLARAAASS